MTANRRETNEPKRRAPKIAALCVACAAVMAVWSLTSEMRTLSTEMERLDAAYSAAADSLRETTVLLESFIEDIDAFALSDDASATAD